MASNINSLLQQGLREFNDKNFEESKKIFEKIILLDKNNFDALQALGVIYGQQGNHKIASEHFLQAYGLKPNNISINLNLANSLLEIGENEKAINFYDYLIKINPNVSTIWCFKGIALKNLKNYDEAINCFKQSLLLDKYNEKAYFNLGTVYRSIKLFEEGVSLFETALKLFNSPNILEVIYTNLSNLFLDIKGSQFGEDYSIVNNYAQKALDINPQNYIALNNLAMSNLFEMKHELAANQLENVISIKPNFAAAHRNLGSLYNHLGKQKLAEKYLKNSIQLEPEDVSKNFLLSEVLLSQNKFSEAWKYYEYRWVDTGDQAPKIKPNFTKPTWNPSIGYNTRLVIWAEQGLGDMLLFSSIIPELVNKFTKVFLLIDKRLCELISDSIPNLEVLDFSVPITEDFFDYQIALCSLGLFFRDNADKFYVQKPLLKIKKTLNIEKKKKYRCAISWQSKGGLKSDKKNINLEALNEILKIDNIEFFDIQYTNDTIENIDYKKRNNIDFEKPPGLDIYNDIYGLAQFIDSCDFIISTSNTNAHLSASLGKPTFLLLPKEYGRLWYWDNDEANNLWYPTIYKFNQIQQGDWSSPILELAKHIKDNYS